MGKGFGVEIVGGLELWRDGVGNGWEEEGMVGEEVGG
jgi:hypothetical protein